GSGMSTHKTADLHLDLLAFRLHSLYRNPADRGKSACTADPEAAFRLRVKIDQSLSFQHAAVQAYRTKKSDLFIYGDQNLQSRMRNIITVKKRKTVCNSDSVVAAQGGSVCRNKPVFYGNIQTVFCEIMIHVRSFFTYHIHMSLDDHSRRILIAGSSGLIDHHIVQFILYILQIVFFREIHKIIADLFRVSGTVGNPADLLKIVKHFLRFTVFQYSHNRFPPFTFIFNSAAPYDRRKRRLY